MIAENGWRALLIKMITVLLFEKFGKIKTKNFFLKTPDRTFDREKEKK